MESDYFLITVCAILLFVIVSATVYLGVVVWRDGSERAQQSKARVGNMAGREK